MISCCRNKSFEDCIKNIEPLCRNARVIVNEYLSAITDNEPFEYKLIELLITFICNEFNFTLPNTFVVISGQVLGIATNKKRLTGLSIMLDDELHIIIYKNKNLKEYLAHELIHYYVYSTYPHLSFKEQENLVTCLTKMVLGKIYNEEYNKNI